MPEIGSEAWIDALNAAVADLEAPAVDVTVLHRIEGGPAWLITVAEGTIGIDMADPGDDADLVFSWQRDDARAVAHGEIGPLVPFQAGRLKVGGDLSRLAEVSDLFARFPAVAAD